MKTVFVRVIMLVASIAVTLSGIEGLLHINNLPNPPTVLGENRKIFSCYRPDPTTIYQTIPGNTLCLSEAVNSDGFRMHPNTPKTRDAVVLLGDSFVFGNYVDASHTVPAYLQETLNMRNQAVQVINAGIPGFGIDQDYVQFIKNVLPKASPKVVIWAIHENDWEEHDYGCLIPQEGEPHILSGYRNTLYWQATISPLLPSFIAQSRLYNFFLSAVPENFTIGCSSMRPISIEKQNMKKKKIFSSMRSLAIQHQFSLYFVYVQSQHAYTDDPPPGHEVETKQKLAVFTESQDKPLVVSEEIKKLSDKNRTLNTVEMLPLDQALFVLDDPSGYGGQHMNEEGNRFFAEVLSSFFKEK